MKKYLINVNGKSYEVEVTEIADNNVNYAPVNVAPQAPQAPQPAPAKASGSANVSGTEVTAPMPGTILKVNVAVGDSVNEGDAVVVLEAMKMENDIPAPCSGKVVAVNTKQGDSIESGDVLVVIA